MWAQRMGAMGRKREGFMTGLPLTLSLAANEKNQDIITMKFIPNQAGMGVREYVSLYLSKEELCACHKLWYKTKTETIKAASA